MKFKTNTQSCFLRTGWSFCLKHNLLQVYSIKIMYLCVTKNPVLIMKLSR